MIVWTPAKRSVAKYIGTISLFVFLASLPAHGNAQSSTTILGKASDFKENMVPRSRVPSGIVQVAPGGAPDPQSQVPSQPALPLGNSPAQPAPAPGMLPSPEPQVPPPSAGPEVPITITPVQPRQPAGQAQLGPPPQSSPPVSRQGERGPSFSPRPGVGRISLNFDDADVFSVIQTIFGEILKVNYVVDQRVKGRVTFRSIAPIPTDQVLPVMETILRINGIGVVEESGLYRVVPISEVAKEPAQIKFGREPEKVMIQGKSIIQVVPLLHVHSSETIKLITPFLTQTAVVIDLPNINYIVIVDTDSNVKRLLTLISFFDGEQTRLKKPQVSVYNIQNGKAKDVAAILQQVLLSQKPAAQPSTTTPQAPGPPPAPPGAAAQKQPTVQTAGSQQTGETLVNPITKIIADENLNALIILSTPEDYEFIKTSVERIDVIPRQVLLEGVVAEVTLKDELKLGISWALQFKPGGMGGVLGGVDGVVGFNMPGAATRDITGLGTFTFAGNVGGDFKTVIDMLAVDNRAKLLAVPHILVSDNKEARIQVGQQVPVVSSETFGSTTVAPQRTIQYKDIGIILKVKPRINEGGLVTLDLAQEVSNYSTIKLFDNEDYIVLNKTETTTSLVCQDGNTIIIGGLIRDDITRARSGIPFLSKIPVLGWLFGATDDNAERTELIILLTPRVIRNNAEANNVTSDYVDSITKTGKGRIRKEDLIKQKPLPVLIQPAPTSGQGSIPGQPFPQVMPNGANQPSLAAPQNSGTAPPVVPQDQGTAPGLSSLPNGSRANPPGAVPPGVE